MRRVNVLLMCCGLVAGCATQPSSPTLLRKVMEIRPDGKREAVPEEKLSAFVHLVRGRLPAKGATGVLAVEKDVAEGSGAEGFYGAVVRSGGGADLRYFEQRQHLPRVDRYYHRAMTGPELAALEGVLKMVPLAKLPGAASGLTVAATEPSTLPGATMEEAVVAETGYRVTAADVKGGETVEVRTGGGARGGDWLS